MASSAREVVTLQIGHYANFVGTHWWNIQDQTDKKSRYHSIGQLCQNRKVCEVYKNAEVSKRRYPANKEPFLNQLAQVNDLQARLNDAVNQRKQWESECNDSSFVYSASDMVYPKEINHDVLFREGRNLKGEITYTPRLIAFDLKGSLRMLRQEGELYDIETEEDNIKWAGDTTLHKVDLGQKNEFLQDLDKDQEEDTAVTEISSEDIDTDTLDTQEAATSDAHSNVAPPGVDGSGVVKLYNLDTSVEVWTDYLRPHLHPRSIHLVQQYQRHNELEPFDVFGFGESVYRHHSSHTEVEDRLHFFLEECDNLQGLHILVDTYDAFGGLASAMLEELADDYVNKGLLVFGVTPASFHNNTQRDSSQRLLNTLLSYSAITTHCSAFVPLTLGQPVKTPPVTWPHLQYQTDRSYHTSAILASSLDTVTLPHRLDGQSCLLSQMTQALTPANRKVVTLQSSLPLPMTDTGSFVDMLMSCGDQLPWLPLTPMCASQSEMVAQSVVVRGIPPNRLKSAHVSHGRHTGQQSVLDGYTTTQEVLDQYLQDVCPDTLSASFAVRTPCKVTAPFPHIFSSNVNKDGFLSHKPRPSTSGVETTPVMTSLQSNTAVRHLLDNMCTEVRKQDVAKVFHRFLEAGLEADELLEAVERVRTLSEYYDTGDDMS